MFSLKKSLLSKWCIQTNLKFQAHLINEWGKAVVETFDLLFFLLADGMDTRVDVYVEWRQQTLVDSHSCDRHCVISPMAHPGDGVGSHGHAAEAPCRWIKSWAAAALVPQTHDCAVSKFRCWGGMKRSGGCCGAVYFSLSVGSLFIDRWGCGVIGKLCGLPMWVNQSDTCHLLSHLPPSVKVLLFHVWRWNLGWFCSFRFSWNYNQSLFLRWKLGPPKVKQKKK